MRTQTLTLALLTLCLLAGNTNAQQVIKGAWQVETIRTVEAPDTETLTFTFADEGKATLTSTTQGEAPQSWSYAYTVEGSTLTLTTTSAPGTPDPKTYEMKFEGDKLMLLELLPEPEEGAPSPEDNREPIWVLKRQSS